LFCEIKISFGVARIPAAFAAAGIWLDCQQKGKRAFQRRLNVVCELFVACGGAAYGLPSRIRSP